MPNPTCSAVFLFYRDLSSSGLEHAGKEGVGVVMVLVKEVAGEEMEMDCVDEHGTAFYTATGRAGRH